MAERTSTYPNITRGQLLDIQRALRDAGIAVHPVALASAGSQPFDAGMFSTRGYDFHYVFSPGESDDSAGTLTVRVSGSLLFIKMAVSKLDGYIQPYLTKV